MGGVQAKPLGLGTLLKNRDLGWHCDVASTEGWSGEVSFSGPTTGLPDKGQSVTQGCISAFFFSLNEPEEENDEHHLGSWVSSFQAQLGAR